ncbi:MAG: EamA family transporter [Elusimicrobiota bacterium]|jgi:drug/metabolite transporter (DMT)-like permease
MNWLALSLLSALFLGLYDVAKKTALDRNAVLPVLLACSACGLGLLLPVLILSHLAPDQAAAWGLAIHPLSSRGHLLVLAKSGIVTLSWVLSYFALKHLPISLAAPVRASAPGFTILGALLIFSERPAPAQWLGLALIIFSYWGFSLIGRKEGIHFHKDRWVWCLFAGTLVGAISGLYDKHLLQAAGLSPMALQFWFTLYAVLIQGLIVAGLWLPQRSRSTPFKPRPSILLVALLLLLSDAIYFRALAAPGALVAIVSTLRRTNVIVSFAVGGIAFRERNRREKALALLGVLLGIGCLVR